MRLAERVRLIENASTEEGHIDLQAQPRLNQQEYEIQNWPAVHAALREIVDRGWFQEQRGQPTAAETYIRDMVETRSAEQALVLSQRQYEELHNSIQQFCDELPRAMRILKAESGYDHDSNLFTVEIGEFRSLEDASTRIADIFDVFGKSLNVGNQPTFAGMDSGSNYLLFEVANEITSWAISVAIQLAQELRNQLNGLGQETTIKMMAAWFRRAMGDRFQSEDSDVADVQRVITDSFVDTARGAIRDEGQKKFPEHQALVNESVAHVVRAIPEITRLLENGANFDRPENDETTVVNITHVINVYGGSVNIINASDRHAPLPQPESGSSSTQNEVENG